MTMRYQALRTDDIMLRDRMKAIAHERRRFGYRRLHVLLRREGYQVNHKRLFRIYREEKLMVRRRGGRKRAMGTRAPMLIPMAPNDRWSLDFVSDQMTDGRRFRVLTVVDDCTRECLTLVADTSLSGLWRAHGMKSPICISSNSDRMASARAAVGLGFVMARSLATCRSHSAVSIMPMNVTWSTFTSAGWLLSIPASRMSSCRRAPEAIAFTA
jgi:hypothetical protein